MATKEVAISVTETTKKYPDATDMFNALQRLQEHADWLDKLRNEAVTAPDSKTASPAPNGGITG
jgi:hypothetical protein